MRKPVSTADFARFMTHESKCVLKAVTFIGMLPVGIVVFTVMKVAYLGYIIKEKVRR